VWQLQCYAARKITRFVITLAMRDGHRSVSTYRVPNTPGNPENPLEIYSLLEIFWFSLSVCTFVVSISCNSCTSDCISTKYIAVNQDQVIFEVSNLGKCQLTHLLIG